MNTHDVITDQYGLSPMQQGMLFHALYDQRLGLYVDHAVFDFPDHVLNVAAFQRAWRRVVDRHPSLRASFHWEGLEAPVQVIHAQVDLPFDFEDCRHLPLSDQEHRIEAYRRSDRERGLTLTEAPLMRWRVFRLGDDHFRCVWTIHHLLADGRSALLILREVFALYDAFSSGSDVQWPAPPSFREHITWLDRQDRQSAESFWRKTLQGFTAPTPLVVDRPSASTFDGPPIEREVRLRRETTAALKALAERHLLSLGTFVQGAWALLLSRYSGEEDVVFGAVRSCRRSSVEGADSIVGVFMNTVPIRVRVPWDAPLLPWLKGLRLQQVPLLKYEHTPLVDVQRWSDLPARTPLFESVLDFADFSLDATLRELGSLWQTSTLTIHEKTNFALTIYAAAEPDLTVKIAFNPSRFDDDAIRRMLGHLETLFEAMAAHPDQRLGDVPLLTPAEERQLLVEWNDTRVEYPRHACIHQLFEAQVGRTPDEIALCFEDRSLTYRELNARANQLARHLGKAGVRPGARVGICMERSLELMVGLLGILKAGAAYVPLDPSFPRDRLTFIVEDAGIEVLVTQERLADALEDHDAASICIDTDSAAISQEPDGHLDASVSSEDLAYVMYTSGSTGQPKGVRVRHRNVVNFFAGMDATIGSERPGVWLAVTSISFDISVLELFWTLTRGFKVIVQSADETAAAPTVRSFRTQQPARRSMDFSLFYFDSDEGGSKEKYRLLLEGAKFADTHGFSAVWTPERHFHEFGGLYPNPSVTGAAVAAVTERTHIRAGSVVLPLQNPIRVAEEWAVVDNLSAGRVGVSFASGWHANDFVFAPEKYQDRKAITFRDVDVVRRLWRGESVSVKNGAGHDVDVRIYPRPVQSELPFWITAAGDPETFRIAGEMGANLLTHLLGATMETLAQNLAIYRKAWRDHGHGRDGRQGCVTLMLHTFVGDDLHAVREKVRAPLMNYLRSASNLARKAGGSRDNDRALSELSEADVNKLHEQKFDRVFEGGGLLGTPATCLATIERLEAIGVDEVACLIDFGVDVDSVMASLHLLNHVREINGSKSHVRQSDYSIPAQIAAHGVTHFQCTPSMARMLSVRPESLRGLAPLRTMLVGGEALPGDLADQLQESVSGEILNMYGPTETTIWSTTAAVERGGRPVPIGRPIANTQTYILDRRRQPVPLGVPGELFIGGDGVAAGYHDRPTLTAERFVENPFLAEPDAKMYRTGDVARYRPDGAIEFLGRVDHQVKIRGHRIELGEIEAVLQRHPSVREAVVVAREDQPGDQRLVGYTVPRGPHTITTGELREYLSGTLPKEMVPAVFVMVDSFPRTPNGKLDRRALPAPDHVRHDTPRTFVAPRDRVESELTRIWERILGVRPISVTDNFFELGGHSLLAVSLFAQIEKTFGKNLPLATLFRGPTIEQLAAILQHDVQSSSSPLVCIQPHGSRPPLFFMHAEGGNVLEYYPLSRSLGTDQPFYALQSDLLNGRGSASALRLEDMAAQYIREIRKVQPNGPYFLGGWCLGGYLAYEAAQQLRAQGEEVALLAMIQTASGDYGRRRPGVTVFHRLLYRLIKRVDLEWSNVRALAPRARVPHLASRAKRLFTIVQLKSESLVDAWLAAFNVREWHSLAYRLEAVGKYHVQAALSYRPKPYPERVTFFRATKQPLDIVPDQTMGWGPLLNGPLDIHDIPAHHQNIMIEPRVSLLAEQLAACVDRARCDRLSELPRTA